MVMTEPIKKLMEEMSSLIREQQEWLREASALIRDLSRISRHLMEQGQADEAKIYQQQEQIRKWKTLSGDLTEQNEILVRQNQELLSLREPLMQEEGSGSDTIRSDVKERWREMTREELLEALAARKQEIHILYTQKISLRELSARLNEENEMLLTLWEEAEQKYGNVKEAYDKLWEAYTRYKGLYETLREAKKK